MHLRFSAAAVALCLATACADSSSGRADAGDAPANTDWALLGNSPEMQHHSDLAEINRKTVGKLELAWWVEMPTEYGLVGNPLIQDGVVFQGGPGGRIFANDVRTGKQLWTFQADYDLTNASFHGYWARQFNRGLALANDKVIIAANCKLIAVDQKTGRKAWEAQSCDPTKEYAISAAPRVGGGLVFTGNACLDIGLERGFVDAFDAETGKHRWRFYTVPEEPSKPQDSPTSEMAAKTWGTGWTAATRGCGSVWDSITYDQKLGQLYIGVGAAFASPEYRAPDAGDELFTNSVVALDAQTGAYKWHFKQVPHDRWNYEPLGIMVADLPIDGKPRRVVLNVPKNGFAYVLDAASGRFISGKNYTPVTWATGLDANGRPILNTEENPVSLPSGWGAHNWDPLAFDPKAGMLYIPALSAPHIMTPSVSMESDQQNDRGQTQTAFSVKPLIGDSKWPTYGELVAWDPVTGTAKWRVRHDNMLVISGLLHTAGGLVFQGLADGHLGAYDAATGKQLWSRQTGGAIRAAPSTVLVDGHQYLIVATGNGTSTPSASMQHRYAATPAAATPARLLAFRIGGSSSYPSIGKQEPVPMPGVPRQDARLAQIGEGLFNYGNAGYENGKAYHCLDCHGDEGGASVGGRVPNLNRRPPTDLAVFKAIVQGGALSVNGMPRFHDMPDADVQALFAYLVNEAWRAHEQDARPADRSGSN